MPQHPKYSSQLIVLLKRALREVLRINETTLREFAEAYELPQAYYDEEPQDNSKPADVYVDELVKEDSISPDEQSLIDIVIYGLFVEQSEWGSGLFRRPKRRTVGAYGVSETVAYHPPDPFMHLQEQLTAEGYAVAQSGIVPIDSEAPTEHQDRTALAAMVRSHDELDSKTLIHHIEESDSTFENRNWHSASGEARTFFEGLIINMALAEARHRREIIPGLPSGTQRKSQFGPCRDYVKKIGFTSSEKDELIRAFYGVASTTGAHKGITDEQTAKLVRRYCWFMGHYVMTKYEAWKANGHHW